ncbi:hypothetical protein C8R45DRAFT_335072 [Mycena sanguinolenta]|nr:hypothetical protein C8R45DRAFT_335072 [Mycena sanguinolenta]
MYRLIHSARPTVLRRAYLPHTPARSYTAAIPDTFNGRKVIVARSSHVVYVLAGVGAVTFALYLSTRSASTSCACAIVNATSLQRLEGIKKDILHDGLHDGTVSLQTVSNRLDIIETKLDILVRILAQGYAEGRYPVNVVPREDQSAEGMSGMVDPPNCSDVWWVTNCYERASTIEGRRGFWISYSGPEGKIQNLRRMWFKLECPSSPNCDAAAVHSTRHRVSGGLPRFDTTCVLVVPALHTPSRRYSISCPNRVRLTIPCSMCSATEALSFAALG